MSDLTVPLPSAPLVTIAQGLTLQPPLSRRGHGPGLIVVDPGYDLAAFPSAEPPSETLDPAPQYKWAEEGYAVVRIAGADIGDGLKRGVEALVQLEACDVKDKFALIVYGTPEEYPSSFTSDLTNALSSSPIVCTVLFSSIWSLTTSPQLVHVPGKDAPKSTSDTKFYNYPSASSSDFIIPDKPTFSYREAAVSHTRSLTFIKRHIGGPNFDLEQIWDEHTYFEFENRSVEKTMGTMVLEPYVNHIPVLTGGVGRSKLSSFYRNHFIWNNPDDTTLDLVSRTVGVDRVVDEFLFCFTHDKVLDWLIPGVPPTGVYLRIPFNAVVNIRGDRLYHEHISWDQATVLRQLGMLPEYLPFPHKVPGLEGKLECRAPVAGIETALKLENQNSVESNQLFISSTDAVRVVKEEVIHFMVFETEFVTLSPPSVAISLPSDASTLVTNDSAQVSTTTGSSSTALPDAPSPDATPVDVDIPPTIQCAVDDRLIMPGLHWTVANSMYNSRGMVGTQCTDFERGLQSSEGTYLVEWTSGTSIERVADTESLCKGYSNIGIGRNFKSPLRDVQSIPAYFQSNRTIETEFKGAMIYDFIKSPVKGAKGDDPVSSEFMLFLRIWGGQLPIGVQNEFNDVTVRSMVPDEEFMRSFEGDLKVWLDAMAAEGYIEDADFVNIGNCVVEVFYGRSNMKATVALDIVL